MSRVVGSFGPRRIVVVIALMLAWCALWGEITAANVLGGLAVSAGASSPLVATPLTGSLRPLALARLVGIIALDLAKSTVAVAREILTPTDYTEELVVEVDLDDGGRRHMLLLTVAVTLTPGTAVIDTDPDNGRLTLHLLHASERDSTIDHVHRLAEVAAEAMPQARGATT